MQKQTAFTLIELLITISIIAIIAGMSYPIYSNYMVKTRRIQAMQNLLLISQQFELYHSQHESYLKADLQTLMPKQIQQNRYYDYTVSEETMQSYQLSATPKSPDTACGTLTLDQLGEKGSSGQSSNAECWLN